jgi:N-acetylglucosamine repressor
MKKNIGEKYSNLERILQILFMDIPLSKPQLAKQTGLTRAAVGVLVEELLNRDLVRKTGAGKSKGGRPPILLQPNYEAAFAIGCAMFDYNWSVVMTDLHGRVIDHIIVKIPGKSPESAVRILGSAVNTIKSKHSEKTLRPYIGVGAPGLVDTFGGYIISAIDLNWRNVPFGEMIRKETGLTPSIVNRSKVSALTAYRLENERKQGNIISVVIGTGVAAGLIINHKLFMGSNFGSGELGHTSLIPNGPLCQCGNRGCLQSLISEQALLERGKNLAILHNHTEPENISEILKEASNPEKFYHLVLLEAAEYLSISIGNLINLLNPDIIVLSGPVISKAPGFTELVRKKVKSRAMEHNLKKIRFIESSWGNETAAIGSALLILEKTEQYLLNH